MPAPEHRKNAADAAPGEVPPLLCSCRFFVAQFYQREYAVIQYILVFRLNTFGNLWRSFRLLHAAYSVCFNEYLVCY